MDSAQNLDGSYRPGISGDLTASTAKSIANKFNVLVERVEVLEDSAGKTTGFKFTKVAGKGGGGVRP